MGDSHKDMFTLRSNISNMSRIFPAVAILLSGCGNSRVSEQSAGQQPYLEQRVGVLEQEVSELRKNETNRNASDISHQLLSINDEGYSYVRGDSGSFTFQMVRLVPSGDGSKATLRIGNLSSAPIYELSFDTEAAPTGADGLADWQNAKMDKHKASVEIPAGQAILTTITVPGISPAKLAYISVSHVSADRIAVVGPLK